jgi:phosphoribosylaminoimidazole-succinocarboxamide synthase
MNASIRYDPTKIVRQGGTKNIYQGTGGNVVLEFTDRTARGAPEGEKGKGPLSCRISAHYFRLLQQRGLPSHFLDACDERGLLLARSARTFGNGIEWIYRGVAAGCFVDRYGMYVKEGTPVPPFIETRLKDDARGNPFVTGQILQMLGIMPAQAYEACLQLCSGVFALVASDLLSRGLALWNMKLELGLDAEGRVMVIDEIGPDCMRVHHGKDRLDGPALGAFLNLRGAS